MYLCETEVVFIISGFFSPVAIINHVEQIATHFCCQEVSAAGLGDRKRFMVDTITGKVVNKSQRSCLLVHVY